MSAGPGQDESKSYGAYLFGQRVTIAGGGSLGKAFDLTTFPQFQKGLISIDGPSPRY